MRYENDIIRWTEQMYLTSDKYHHIQEPIFSSQLSRSGERETE